MVKSNFDDNNLFTVNISPISSKQEYSCLCEVVEEYGGNLDYLMSKIGQAIKKNTLLYQDYSNADHLDIGSHCHAFPSFDLGGWLYSLCRYVLAGNERKFSDFPNKRICS